MKRFLLTLLVFPVILHAQHTITGTFSPPENYTYAFLYNATPRSMAYVDRAEVDSLGQFKFTMDENDKSGIYKIVYAIPQNEYNFNLIYSGKEDIDLKFSEEAGLEFMESTENKLWTSYTKSMEMVNATISSYYNKGGEDKQDFNEVFKALENLQNAYEQNSEGYMAKKLITANRPYIPTEYEDLATYAKNLKNTYLDNIDFSSEILQSSELITDKVMTFIFGISPDSSDGHFKNQLDKLDQYTEGLDVKSKIPIYLPIWEHFKLTGNNSMATYLIDEYLMDMAENSLDAKLVKTFLDFKNNALGSQALDFDIVVEHNGRKENSSLHNLEGYENYVIVFWSSTCSHCLRELPRLQQFLKNRSDIKVIAFAIEDDDTTWKPEIENYPEFIHVLGLDKWYNKTVTDYNVTATPSYFFLDQNKHIISKPEDVYALQSELKSKE